MGKKSRDCGAVRAKVGKLGEGLAFPCDLPEASDAKIEKLES